MEDLRSIEQGQSDPRELFSAIFIQSDAQCIMHREKLEDKKYIRTVYHVIFRSQSIKKRVIVSVVSRTG